MRLDDAPRLRQRCVVELGTQGCKARGTTLLRHHLPQRMRRPMPALVERAIDGLERFDARVLQGRLLARPKRNRRPAACDLVLALEAVRQLREVTVRPAAFEIVEHDDADANLVVDVR